MTAKTYDGQTAKFIAVVVENMPKDLTGDVMQGWIDNPTAVQKALKDAFCPPEERVEPTEKFALLKDFGIITVPDDYDHATRLATFLEQNSKKFYGVNDDITDEHFPNPSRILKPGDKLRVSAFKQIVSGTTTSEERMVFLEKQGAVYTGAQGASLVFDQKRDQLPKGKWYCSFDEKNRLWKDADGDRRVPRVSARSGGGFDFNLVPFENTWDGDDALLCFSDL